MKYQQGSIQTLRALVREIPDFPKKGVMFRDITPLLKDPTAFSDLCHYMAYQNSERYTGGFSVVAAAESRGFIFAAPLAVFFAAGLVPIRKPGKLPYKCRSHDCELEYGKTSLQMHEDAIEPGQRVLFVDDVLATGGTTLAACKLIEEAGGIVAGCVFVIELKDLKGREKLKGYNVFSVLEYD